MTEEPAPYLPPSPSNVDQQVKGPAYALIATAILNLLTLILTAVMYVMGMDNLIDPAMFEQWGLPQELIDILQEALAEETDPMLAGIEHGANLVNFLVTLIMCGFIFYGGVQMMKLRKFGFALTAAILATLPCTYCCCPCVFFGIWALVVLLKPEVKYAFYQQTAPA